MLQLIWSCSVTVPLFLHASFTVSLMHHGNDALMTNTFFHYYTVLPGTDAFMSSLIHTFNCLWKQQLEHAGRCTCTHDCFPGTDTAYIADKLVPELVQGKLNGTFWAHKIQDILRQIICEKISLQDKRSELFVEPVSVVYKIQGFSTNRALYQAWPALMQFTSIVHKMHGMRHNMSKTLIFSGCWHHVLLQYRVGVVPLSH